MTIERTEKPSRMNRRATSARKVDRFLADKTMVIDYKDPSMLKYFITERGKLVPRRVSGLCAKNQRKITQAVKRARMIALMPFTTIHSHS